MASFLEIHTGGLGLSPQTRHDVMDIKIKILFTKISNVTVYVKTWSIFSCIPHLDFGLDYEYSKHFSTWIDSDERSFLLPFGPKGSFWESLEEDEKTDIPEGGKTGVVDGIEDCNEEPGLGGSWKDCAIVWIIQEISESFPTSSVPAGWLDGHGSQQFFFFFFSSSFSHLVCLILSELLKLKLPDCGSLAVGRLSYSLR